MESFYYVLLVQPQPLQTTIIRIIHQHCSGTLGVLRSGQSPAGRNPSRWAHSGNLRPIPFPLKQQAAQVSPQRAWIQRSETSFKFLSSVACNHEHEQAEKKTIAEWTWYIAHDPSEEHVLIFARGCFSPQKHEKQHVLGLCKSPGGSCNSIEFISNIDHPNRVELRKYKVMFRRKVCRLKHERLECTQTIWVLLPGTTIDQNLVIHSQTENLDKKYQATVGNIYTTMLCQPRPVKQICNVPLALFRLMWHDSRDADLDGLEVDVFKKLQTNPSSADHRQSQYWESIHLRQFVIIRSEVHHMQDTHTSTAGSNIVYKSPAIRLQNAVEIALTKTSSSVLGTGLRTLPKTHTTRFHQKASAA